MNQADPPFACPPDTVLDIPVPPSVNATRRVHWAGHREMKKWRASAGNLLLASGQYRKAHKGFQKYELTVILSEQHCKLDPDNTLKAAGDFLKRLKIITDDAPKYARRIVVEWGEAPEGCRLIVRGAE